GGATPRARAAPACRGRFGAGRTNAAQGAPIAISPYPPASHGHTPAEPNSAWHVGKLGQGRGGELDREKPMKGDVLLNGHFPADYLRRERRDRLEDQDNLPLNPVVGWSIALLVSAGLWWSIGVAVSSLVSVVL